MGGRDLLAKFRSWRRRRFFERQYARSPRLQPHWPIIVQHLVDNVPPMQKRLRRDYLELIADGIVALDPMAEPYLAGGRGGDEPAIGGLALLCLRALEYLERLDTQEAQVIRTFTAFGKYYSQITDPQQQRRVIENYLRETVADPAQLRGDLEALDRFFGFDTLRERNAYAQMDLTIQVELILWFLASAFASTGAAVAAMHDGLAIAAALATRLADASRWQVRHAAGSALVALIRAHRVDYPPALMAGLLQVIENDEEHPWVLATAVQAILLLDAARGIALIEHRLIADRREGNDLVFRKLAVDMATNVLDRDALDALLTRLVASGEPSEYVRQTFVRATVALTAEDAVAQLSKLAAQTDVAEPSYRVRAAAYIAARERAVNPATSPALLVEISRLLIAALAGEKNTFALVVACEELAKLAENVVAAATLSADEIADLVAQWQAALAAVVEHPKSPPRVTEVAAAMMELIESATDAARRRVRDLIGESLRATKPYGASSLVARGARALAPQEEAHVGRVLAELSRSDWGVSAQRRGQRWRFWRGDQFGRRLWRIVHELRNPLPNKRQAFAHTVGRRYPGGLRAHPGLLDEATATTVPGERTNVDAEGSWCRHLPLVDDVLDLPILGDAPATVVSSLGTAVITPPAKLWDRVRNRYRISMRYRNLAAARMAALRATEDRERHRYIEMFAKEYGVRIEFTPHPHGAVAPYPQRVRALFEGEAPADGKADAALAPVPTAAAGLAMAPWDTLTNWLSANQYYFTSAKENSQAALAIFVAGMTSLFFIRSFQKRRIIHNSRFSMPLTIGGWGTRGKSGTERLKAGFLDGLGFDVFVKTTGCEAMFIHSAPMQQPVEIFIYRPYDKATIWEQMNQIRLASRLKGDVFLWECMALNPKYVQLLQHDWMQDDLVTLTNCYPDHEDIQGPAGYNVAQVISEFIPFSSTLITSETSYLPLFQDKCAARNTPMHIIGERDAEFIADDFLDLFPYREHPRNIALVTKCATELGVDADLAQYTMAKCVVPDLGVLKAYPKVKVRARLLTFVCGNSANERTGFINNWRRMKLDAMNWEAEPQKLVITVVNNRADRISRSEVFARILVRDVAFDRHVLIGTNLKGLRGFMADALTDYLKEQHLVNDDEIDGGDKARTLALSRAARELEQLRIPRPELRFIVQRLGIYAQACGQALAPDNAALADAISSWLAADPKGTVNIADLIAEVTADAKLTAALEGALQPMAADDPNAYAPEFPETLEAPGLADVLSAFRFELARMAMRARLEARLTALFVPGGGGGLAAFRADFAQAYKQMFLLQVDTIEDAGATGDQIIDRCARCIPPGSDVILMGTQNIKGTGLDFVYRWLAMDKVVTCLNEQKSVRREKRMAALAELEAFEDHGLVDTGHLLGLLARPPLHAPDEDELAARQRIVAKVTQVYERRRKALLEVKKADWLDRAAAWGEGWIDYIDSVHRTNASRRITDDLVNRRITHGRASLEMRKLVGRIKGGWLAKAIRKARK